MPTHEADAPRILSMDYGLTRIGLAVSDPLGMFATGLATIANTGKKALWQALRHTVATYDPVTLVLGLPRHMNGQEGEQAELTRQFADEWCKRFPTIPVVFWDERLTSRMAEQTLQAMGKQPSRHKADIDQLCAIRLLQEYLDSRAFSRQHTADIPAGDNKI
jgi:putative holliday junction resolvase